ncbi:MAG: hypothetical protein AB6733_24630 [Clostridiaceae bacterium]
MNWESYKELSKRWRDEGKAYAEATNKFVEEGMKKGWDNVGEEPEETRFDIAEKVVEIIKQANRENEIEKLRENFPPAHVPLIDIFEEAGQAITSVLITDDNKIIFKAGDDYEQGKLFVIEENKINVIEGALYVGCAHNKKVYAVAYKDCIKIYDGWGGKEINTFNWPNGSEGYGSKKLEFNEHIFSIKELIPFSDGERVLLVCYAGVFVLTSKKTLLLTSKKAIRLHPNEDDLEELDEEEVSDLRLDMVHGALSPDERYIAVGDQCSDHIILNSNNYKQEVSVIPESSYPHYALFSEDGKHVIFNSCHFYNGITTQFSLDDIHDEDEFEGSAIEIDDSCRVYAGVSRGEEYIIGDADGYIRAYNVKGEFRWQFYIGSTISGMDISKDGKRLLVGTYAGMIHLLQLDAERRSEYSIGTANILELGRWISWKGEKEILQW